jgi:hypothetical protein
MRTVVAYSDEAIEREDHGGFSLITKCHSSRRNIASMRYDIPYVNWTFKDVSRKNVLAHNRKDIVLCMLFVYFVYMHDSADLHITITNGRRWKTSMNVRYSRAHVLVITGNSLRWSPTDLLKYCVHPRRKRCKQLGRALKRYAHPSSPNYRGRMADN